MDEDINIISEDKPTNSDSSETDKKGLKTKTCPKCGKVMYSNEKYFSNRRFCSKICRQLFCSNAYYHEAKKKYDYREKRSIYYREWYGKNKDKMRAHMRNYMNTKYKLTKGYKKLQEETSEMKQERRARRNISRRNSYVRRKYGQQYAAPKSDKGGSKIMIPVSEEELNKLKDIDANKQQIQMEQQ